ncbi:MAG: hypothetical protein H7A01_16860 [Hahellaceae bacterium]|nr:hypothetical protein [Hahellaceae bacterium]MCP5211979.1 hypothetical protein [Hahellaceae bacterium]
MIKKAAFPRRLIFIFAALSLSLSAFAVELANEGYVGAEVCRGCHIKQYSDWQGSHHDKAMQEANDKTVLGDFADTSLSHFGVTSFFFKADGKYFVKTEGETGALETFEIKYTFGVYPLQQYLIEFPGGRMQALSVAWDARPHSDGGQRWFHLYPDEKIAADDELHWTRLSQNWNNMCADCHSTNLQKNYNASTKTFASTWSEINVSCEACHGPGAGHLNWVNKAAGWEAHSENAGLVISLDDRKHSKWSLDAATGKVQRSGTASANKEIDMCARCHSRRSAISKQYIHGEPLLDHYLPSLLESPLYHPDGQINDEVYVYGSFVQSKMFQAGVTCSDCHEPHSMSLRAEGNGVCLQCHQAKKYDAPSHHFHASGSAGASCAECHMPPKNYMVVDPRHDHSIRIPRPDLTEKIGTPNACNNCHQDKSAVWASSALSKWLGKQPAGFQNYAEVLQAGRKQSAGAGKTLADFIRLTDTANIAKATALTEIGPYLNASSIDVVAAGLQADDPAVRVASVQALALVPLNYSAQFIFPMLTDPIRAVRIESARVLSPIPPGQLPATQQKVLDDAMQAFVVSQLANAERPEAQTNLGNFYTARGQIIEAEAAYKTAIELSPVYIPAYINLADFYRALAREKESEAILRQAIVVVPNSAAAHHALGLLLVRKSKLDSALTHLKFAAENAVDDPQFIYVYAVALNSTGQTKQAILILQGAHNRFSGNVDILAALAAFNRDEGNLSGAQMYAEKLRKLQE